jgi:hypothetical protein
VIASVFFKVRRLSSLLNAREMCARMCRHWDVWLCAIKVTFLSPRSECEQNACCTRSPSIGNRIMLKIIDYNLLSDVMKVIMPWLPDYKLIKKAKTS